MANVDLHVHSRYSDRPSEWFLQRLGASLSYTEPEFVYDTAKERGMSFVTLTDHNTIDGSLELASKYKDAFTGAEITTYFPEDRCKIHLAIWGMTADQFDEIQDIRQDIYELRDYLREHQITYSVAHALYSINNKLSREHIEKLILLFDIFEIINGGMNEYVNNTWYATLKSLTPERMDELAQKYSIQPWGEKSWIKGFTGASDDHAGIFIGKTYTMASATTMDGFLEQVRRKKGIAKGRSNDYQSLAFTLYKIAHDFSKHQRSTINRTPTGALLNHFTGVIFDNQKSSMMDNLVVMGLKADNNNKYRILLAELIAEIKKQKHFDIEKNLDILYDKIASIADEYIRSLITTIADEMKKMDVFAMTKSVASSLPGMFLAVPFFTSAKHLSNSRALVNELNAELPQQRNPRILWFTDTLNDLNGPSVTLKNLGWQFYSHGIDMQIVCCLKEEELSEDLPPNIVNLPHLYEFALPYYEQYLMKIPSLLKAMKMLNSFHPDEILISTPGPVGLVGLAIARLFSVPAVGIYHTDFSMESLEITNDESVYDMLEFALKWFYTNMDHVKVPTQEYIDILSKRGLDPQKMSVFPRQIDHGEFKRLPEGEITNYRIDGEDGVNLLFVGRVSKDKNLPFLNQVFKRISETLPDLNLYVVGSGPYLEEMKEELKEYDRAKFLGRVPHEKLPEILSQGHIFVFPSTTDTFGMAVLEAQSSELPAIVSDVGGPKEIIEDGVTGFVAKALDEEDWIEKITRMHAIIHNDPAAFEQMRKTARARTLQYYGWEAVLRGLASEELIPAALPDLK